MTNRKILKFDYETQVSPLVADCLYYNGLNVLPEMLRFASRCMVLTGVFTPRLIGKIMDEAPSDMPVQFFEASNLYHSNKAIFADEEWPSLECLQERVERRVDELLKVHLGKYDGCLLYYYVFKDLCAAHKSTGASAGHTRVAIEWNLSDTIETLVKVREGSEDDSYIPPRDRLTT